MMIAKLMTAVDVVTLPDCKCDLMSKVTPSISII